MLKVPFHCLLALFVISSSSAGAGQVQTRGFAPTSAQAEQFQRANDALRADHIDEAIVALQQLTLNAPRFAEAHLNLGLALTQAGRNAEAAAALSKAIELKPSLRGAHLFLAIAQYRDSQFDRAKQSIREETARSPNDAQAWMWQGIIDLALSHFTVALESLNRAVTLDPKNVDILYHRGRAALALSRESYEAMFKLDPHSWHIHQVLAQAGEESGRDADAVEEYKLAIAAAAPQSGLYEALGSSLWRLGRFAEAEAAYEAALKMDPNDTITLYKLGCLKVDRGDAAAGKPLLERVARIDPSLEMLPYYSGRADLLLGNTQAAVDEFKQVVEVNADPETTKQAWYQLSRAYRRLNDPASAKAAETHYRSLEQAGRENLEEKLSQRRQRADRDVSIPPPTLSRSDTQP